MSESRPAPGSWFQPGSVVAGYRLEAQVGAGGMAVVFRARDERLGRAVALKLLAPGLASDPGFRQRFIRESRAAAAVDDPHIIPVYEAGEADGALFIAMRLVRGGDLRLVLDRDGPLPPARAVAFLSPVASALDAAHAAGLVHRDVKPANILIDARSGRPDHVYLSDFGVSKGVGGAGSLTGAGHYLGTPDYSAPEQVQGTAVDGRADQYALACVAYQMLGGCPPFERDQGMAVLLAHLSEPPPALCPRRPDLPAATDGVLARALAKAPADRYPSCRDFADALREALGMAPYHPPGNSSAPGHARTEIAAPPQPPVPAADGDREAAGPAGGTRPALSFTAVAPPSPESAEQGIAPFAAMADTASLPDGRAKAEGDPGRTGRAAVPPPAGAGPRGSVKDAGKPRPAWRARRFQLIALAGAALVAAATGAAVLAASPSPRPTLAYSQFLTDVKRHAVKTVDIAPSAGDLSSGTLTNGTAYTIAIPPQAGQQLLVTLQVDGVQVTAASSSGTPATISYTQFLLLADAHRLKTVDIAPSAGDLTSGTLTNGAAYTMVIPPQAGLPLLLLLRTVGVEITAASSSGTRATLTYSQFLNDTDDHVVKTLDIAASAGGISTGTLASGAAYTVVIPPQAQPPFADNLRALGVKVTEASSTAT